MINSTQLIVVQDDITNLEVDAIVNAANKELEGGGGVDGAIHRAAGKELLEECRSLHGCETGQAKVTKGYNLKAKYVIHSVGPVWNEGETNEEALLGDAYKNALAIAKEKGFKNIAFPNISTGIYHFPKVAAAKVAIQAVKDFLVIEKHNIERVYFVCYDTENYNIYQEKL
jgi:O-acetyl-ADP-ribose deacetylase (regulator of RNase III)